MIKENTSQQKSEYYEVAMPLYTEESSHVTLEKSDESVKQVTMFNIKIYIPWL